MLRNNSFYPFFFLLYFSTGVYAVEQTDSLPTGLDKPNIILIVADDLGFGDLSINGSTQIKTPNIDELAKTGVNFTEGYVTSPVCSPSRAGFMTGKNQVSFGYDNNIGGSQTGFDPEFLGLPITQKTIANYLKPLGYANGLVGKWHLGDAPQFHPLKRGFDEFWGYKAIGNWFDYQTVCLCCIIYRPIPQNKII